VLWPDVPPPSCKCLAREIETHRWELADLLETTEKEHLFREHVETLAEKKRLQFRKLLKETPQVCTHSSPRVESTKHTLTHIHT